MITTLKREKGFTLIEIALVLALAALILILVFIALSGAQKARRDTARVSEAGQIASAIDAYASNNNGLYPTAALASTYFTGISDVDTGNVPTWSHATATASSGENYYTSYICSTTTLGAMTTTGASSRNYAISYWSERAGSAACKDNT